MVLPTSFATSMLAWGMLTFGDVSSSALSNWTCLCPAVALLLRSYRPCFCLCHLSCLCVCEVTASICHSTNIISSSCMRLSTSSVAAQPSATSWTLGRRHQAATASAGLC